MKQANRNYKFKIFHIIQEFSLKLLLIVDRELIIRFPIFLKFRYLNICNRKK